MKLLHIYIFIFSISISYAQSGGYTFFETGTLEEWTNSNGSITNLSIEERGSNEELYLRKSCDGTNTVNGEMAIKNPLYFQDNYMDGGAGQISMDVKNDNSFDLYLRLGFTDYDGSKIVFTNPIVIPPDTGWHLVTFDPYPQSFTLIEGPNSITEVLFQTYEMWLIHSEEPSFIGDYVNGHLEIDNVGTLYLGTEDFQNESVNIYPIPSKGIVYVETNHSKIDRIEIYDSLGRKQNMEFSTLNEIDLSSFSNGIYFLRTFSETGVLTKKIIKN